MQISYLAVLTATALSAQAGITISGNTDNVYIDGTTTLIGSAALSRMGGKASLTTDMAALSSDMSAMKSMMTGSQASSILSSVSSKVSSALSAALSSKGDAPAKTGPLAVGAFVAAFSVLLL